MVLLLVILTMGNSIAIPLLTIYDVLKRYGYLSSVSAPNKSMVDRSIYAKYKNWQPKQPSYFELLKVKEERLQ